MLNKPLDTFFRLPDNLKLFVVALIACNLAVSNYHCNERNQDAECPVEYEVIPGENSPLQRKWRFIGFENVLTKQIEYPPCGGNEAFLILTDSLANRPEKEVFYYPYYFQGRTLINSYLGSYLVGEENEIRFSETIRSHVKGSHQIEQFQGKYHNALKTAERYQTSDNLLQIFYDGGSSNLLFVAQDDTIMY